MSFALSLSLVRPALEELAKKKCTTLHTKLMVGETIKKKKASQKKKVLLMMKKIKRPKRTKKNVFFKA